MHFKLGAAAIGALAEGDAKLTTIMVREICVRG